MNIIEWNCWAAFSCHNIKILKARRNEFHPQELKCTFYHRNYKHFDRFKNMVIKCRELLRHSECCFIACTSTLRRENVNGIITLVCTWCRKNMKLIQTTTILNANNYNISVQSLLVVFTCIVHLFHVWSHYHRN